MNFSYKLSACGFPVELHYTFFILLLLNVATSLQYFNVFLTLLEFLQYGPILLTTAIIHELSHLLATKMLGGDTSGGLVLWPLGGFALCGPTPKGLFGDLTVSIVGPLSHIPQSLVWFGLFTLLAPEEDELDAKWFRSQVFSSLIHTNELRKHFLLFLCAKAVQLNILMLCFNFLPIYPLDGGRIFVSSLLLCGVKQTATGQIAGKAGMALSIIGGLVWGIFYSRSTFSLVIFAWCFYQSWSLNRLSQNDRVDEHPLFATAAEMNNDESGNALIGNADAGLYVNYDETVHVGRPQWWKFWASNNNNGPTQFETNVERPSWSNADGSKSNNIKQTTEQPKTFKFWSNRGSSRDANNGTGLMASESNARVEEDYGF